MKIYQVMACIGQKAIELENQGRMELAHDAVCELRQFIDQHPVNNPHIRGFQCLAARRNKIILRCAYHTLDEKMPDIGIYEVIVEPRLDTPFILKILGKNVYDSKKTVNDILVKWFMQEA